MSIFKNDHSKWMGAIFILSIYFGALGLNAQSFVNWENPPLHAVDISPDGNILAVVNLPDNRLELFSLSSGLPVSIGAVTVGLDPVSVRFRDNEEVWVVNLISDSISVVDVAMQRVIATIQTKNEPYDLIFSGTPLQAFVSCSQANVVQVIDPITYAVLDSDEIVIDAENPRAMAVNADGSKVYVAIFNSGNASTILGGGSTMGGGFPPNVVSDPIGPYGGVNPPPNFGVVFEPAITSGLPAPPAVGMIVKKDELNQWMDDNNGNWTDLVSGVNAAASGRSVGWDLPDRDVAIIDTSNLSVTYATGLMNICMAMAVNPATDEITVVGTDAINEIRFEPQVNGVFVRAKLATVDSTLLTKTVVDLNAEHLDYSVPTVVQGERDKSIGNPRGIVWNAAGTKGYVTGMGSNNLIVIDPNGVRSSVKIITMDEGPLALAMDDSREQLYVLNRFASTITVVDTNSETIAATVSLHDPTPLAIKTGRPHFYNTHKTSGLGQVSCASCHVDGRTDRLSWDLGAPNGSMKAVTDVTSGGQHNLGAGLLTTGFQDFHPMKGPMLTQTLHDIIGHEPLHWRGDRDGIEEFSGAFLGLQGDDVTLTGTEMQEFEDFLASIHVEPNPFRQFDNTLPTSVDLVDQVATGRHGLAAGSPMPIGNAQNGLNIYRTVQLDGNATTCVSCHTLPTGMGTDTTAVGLTFTDLLPGINGEHHLALVSVDGSTNVTMKIPHLRNVYRRSGFNAQSTSNRAGFGFLHDGSVDTITRFIDEPVFATTSDQQVADLVAFMLAFSGSDLPQGSTNVLSQEPPGPPSKDSPASVGRQVTVVGNGAVDLFGQGDVVTAMINRAQSPGGRVDLIARGVKDSSNRGWFYDRSTSLFQSDIVGETISPAGLLALADPTTPLTYTLVPRGSGERIGIDRDEDGIFDGDEVPAVACWNCAGQAFGDSNGDGFVTMLDYVALASGWMTVSGNVSYDCCGDFNRDGAIDEIDLFVLLENWMRTDLPLCTQNSCL